MPGAYVFDIRSDEARSEFSSGLVVVELRLRVAYKQSIPAVYHASLGPGYRSDNQQPFPYSLVQLKSCA